MENEKQNGNLAKPMLAAGCSCINCKNYYFAAPQHDQPYPEFSCTKGHWGGIGSTEEYYELFNETFRVGGEITNPFANTKSKTK